MVKYLNAGQIKFYLMMALVLSLPFSESLKSIVLFLLLFVSLAQIFRKEIVFRFSLLHAGFVGLILSALISGFFAENMMKAMRGVSDIMYCSIAFFVAAGVSDGKQTRVILWGLYISAVVASVVGIVHFFQTGALEISQLRNPNYIAMYLIIILSSMISSIVLSDRETVFSKTVLVFFAMIILTASVMTTYRSSFIGLFLLIFMLLFAKKDIKYSLISGAALISAVTLAIFLFRPLWEKMLVTSSLIARYYLWEGAFSLFMRNPFFGIGPNHYVYAPPVDSPDFGGINTDAHSIYFNTLAQTGIFGLISLLTVACGFMTEFYRARSLSPFGLALKYGALGGFLVTFASGFLDSTFHHGHGIVFALLAGLFFAHSRRHDS